MIKVDLGCGNGKKTEYLGIDAARLPGVDLVCDLSQGIPLKDNSVDAVYTRHFLEHISNPLLMIEEIHRILRKDCIAEVIVPHWSWYGAHTFMHKCFFHSRDFYFLDPDDPYNYYTRAKFKVLSVSFNWGKFPQRPVLRHLNVVISRILDFHKTLSEDYLVKIFSPMEIRVMLKKV